MRKLAVLVVLAAITFSTAAFAQYTSPWTQTWDFSNGTQGWIITNNGGPYSPAWIDPAAG